MSLVDRTRVRIASVEDGYFEDSEILDYLNSSKVRVVSGLLQIETAQKKSLRALDQLRSRTSINPLTGFIEVSGYWEGTVDFPATLLQFDQLRYGTTPLKELTGRLYLLQQGNNIPSKGEGYFTVVERKWELYLHEEPASPLHVWHVKKPSALNLESDSLGDLPDTLENAVIYGAVVLAALKEGNGSFEGFNAIYQQELQANAI